MCLLTYVRNYFLTISILFGFIDIIDSSLPDGFSCFQSGFCKCTGNNGEVVDLSLLVNSSQPLISASTNYLYMYHPCSDVPLVSKVQNLCQEGFGLCYFVPKTPTDSPVDYNNAISNATFGSFQLLAVNREAVMRINQNNQIEIVYKHTFNSSTVTTIVKLECNENIGTYKLNVDNNSPEHRCEKCFWINKFMLMCIRPNTENSFEVLTLSSHYACVKVPHHMSGGTIFFIIIIVFLSLYFIGGIIVLKFIRGATGVEMIPNHEFWCKIPQLAKDGIAYLSSCGKNTPDSYDKI